MQRRCAEEHMTPMHLPADRPPCFYHMPESVKGLRDECQETGRVFVFPEALFFFPLLLFSSSLSPRQLVAAGGEALGDLEEEGVGGRSI